MVVDSDNRWLTAVAAFLRGAGMEVETAATAADGLAAVQRLNPALLVTELEVEGTLDGAELIRQVRALAPAMTIVAFAASQKAEEIAAARLAGASLCLQKPPAVNGAATAVGNGLRTSLAANGGAGTRLTRREHEILRLVAEGRSNAELAGLLWVSRQTVKFHLRNIYRKLGVSNRADAVRWAREHGLDLPGATDPIARTN